MSVKVTKDLNTLLVLLIESLQKFLQKVYLWMDNRVRIIPSSVEVKTYQRCPCVAYSNTIDIYHRNQFHYVVLKELVILLTLACQL